MRRRPPRARRAQQDRYIIQRIKGTGFWGKAFFAGVALIFYVGEVRRSDQENKIVGQWVAAKYSVETIRQENKRLRDQLADLQNSVDQLQIKYTDMANRTARYIDATRHGFFTCDDGNGGTFTMRADIVQANKFLAKFVSDGLKDGTCDPKLPTLKPGRVSHKRHKI